MAGTCSAVPKYLIDYGVHGIRIAGAISKESSELKKALDEFRRSNPSAKYIARVPALDTEVDDWAGDSHSHSRWVGLVGEGFDEADEGGNEDLVEHLDPGADPDSFLVQTKASTVSKLAKTEQQNLELDERSSRNADEGRGKSDAQRLEAALKEKDWDKRWTKVQRLLEKLDAHKDDPVYMRAFLKELGPENLAKVAALMQGDPKTMATLSHAFATAMSDWHGDRKDFVNELLGPEHNPDLGALGMLFAHGRFPSDVTGLAGTLLVSDPNGYTSFLEGLAKEPDLAREWLLASGRDGTRYEFMLTQMMNVLNHDPKVAKAFGKVLEAASTDMSRPERTRLLEFLAGLHNGQVPDGLRDGLAKVLSENVDLLAAMPAKDRDRLFRLAEEDATGAKVDSGRVKELLNAIRTWLDDHPPADKRHQTITRWSIMVGRLFDSWLAPQDEAARKAGDDEKQTVDYTSLLAPRLINYLVKKVPVVGDLLSKATGFGVGQLKGWLEGEIDKKVAHGMSVRDATALVTARLLAVSQIAQVDPSSVYPPGVEDWGPAQKAAWLEELASVDKPDDVKNYTIVTPHEEIKVFPGGKVPDDIVDLINELHWIDDEYK